MALSGAVGRKGYRRRAPRRLRKQDPQRHKCGERRHRLRRLPRPVAGRRVEHPGRDLPQPDHIGAGQAASCPGSGCSLDHFMHADGLPRPRMPRVGNRHLASHRGTVGLVSWSSTILAGGTQRWAIKAHAPSKPPCSSTRALHFPRARPKSVVTRWTETEPPAKPDHQRQNGRPSPVLCLTHISGWPSSARRSRSVGGRPSCSPPPRTPMIVRRTALRPETIVLHAGGPLTVTMKVARISGLPLSSRLFLRHGTASRSGALPCLGHQGRTSTSRLAVTGHAHRATQPP